jgi:FtsP/CotA-like multicopper oxidase with cupredoxin domain
MSLPTVGPYVRRHFRVERVGGEWMLGNMTWKQVEGGDFTKVLASPAIGDVEIWEISNHAEGWNHPVHIHLTDFRIFKRVGGAGRVFPFEEGPKDVMYLGEGETVHVLVKFTEPGGDPQVKGGRYMVHCHNFVHEDHDMMGQFSVGSVDFGTDPHHPIRAAPPGRI